METYEDSRNQIPFGHGMSVIRFRSVGPSMIFYFILQTAGIYDCQRLRNICNRHLTNLHVNCEASRLENRLHMKRTVVITQALLPTLTLFNVIYLISWTVCLLGYSFANHDFEHRLLIAEIAIYNVLGMLLLLFPIVILYKFYALPEALNNISCISQPEEVDLSELLRGDEALQRFQSLDEQWNYAYEKYKRQTVTSL